MSKQIPRRSEARAAQVPASRAGQEPAAQPEETQLVETDSLLWRDIIATIRALLAENERLEAERDAAVDEFQEARNTSYLERAEAAERRVAELREALAQAGTTPPVPEFPSRDAISQRLRELADPCGCTQGTVNGAKVNCQTFHMDRLHRWCRTCVMLEAADRLATPAPPAGEPAPPRETSDGRFAVTHREADLSERGELVPAPKARETADPALRHLTRRNDAHELASALRAAADQE